MSREIIELLQQQGDAFDLFKKANNDRFKNIEQALESFAKKHARAAFSVGSGFSAEDTEEKAAFLGYLRTGAENLGRKAMSSSSDPDGGYLIPAEIDTVLSKALLDASPMRQIARVVPVTSADFSMLHSAGGTGYAWVGETGARPPTATPSFMKISPTIGEVYANLPVTQNLLDDNGFDLEGWLVTELADTFSAAEGDAFINGNGVVSPRGILTYDIASTADGVRATDALQYVASGGAGAFAASNPADKLVKLVHSLKPAYRKGASWLMNTNTLEAVRIIKDGQGNWLWRASAEMGQPDTLLGYPVFEDENMPDIAADSLSIAFGNFQRGYVIADRSTSLLRDPFTAKPYVNFYSTRRVGGTVRDFRAIKLMKFANS